MMGSGSPFEGMPGGIGEQNGMIRLPYHPLTSLIRHFDKGQALALLHSGRGGADGIRCSDCTPTIGSCNTAMT